MSCYLNVLLSVENKDSGEEYSNHLPSKRVEEFQDNIGNVFLNETSIAFPEKALSWIENGYQLNHLSSIADKLFDEARQTGIDQEKFLQLFYRFGSQIREITEIAYEKPAGEDANADKQWDAAVNRFKETTEWK
jgi:hypothetical protein